MLLVSFQSHFFFNVIYTFRVTFSRFINSIQQLIILFGILLYFQFTYNLFPFFVYVCLLSCCLFPDNIPEWFWICSTCFWYLNLPTFYWFCSMFINYLYKFVLGYFIITQCFFFFRRFLKLLLFIIPLLLFFLP